MRRTALVDRTSDEIETWLVAAEHVIGRIRAEQMELLREVARRQLPLADGCRSLAEWAAGRLDISARSARGLTTTAQKLGDLPTIEAAASRGEWSFDRTVELAKLATSETQQAAADGVRHLDIAGLKRQIAHRRRLTTADEQDIAATEHIVLRPNLDESRWDIWGRLGGYHGRIVDKALATRADRQPAPPEGMRIGFGKRRADALVSVCQDSLDGSRSSAAGEDHLPRLAAPLVTVFVDANESTATNGETGAHIEAGPRVGPGTLDQILCSGSVEVIGRGQGGTPLAVAQAGRRIPPKLRRFVLARDGACTADGCDSLYRLEPHHTIPYAESKRHHPDELATLCWWHHHVVIHQFGYRIDPTTPRGRHRFIPPDPIRSADPP